MSVSMASSTLCHGGLQHNLATFHTGGVTWFHWRQKLLVNLPSFVWGVGAGTSSQTLSQMFGKPKFSMIMYHFYT